MPLNAYDFGQTDLSAYACLLLSRLRIALAPPAWGTLAGWRWHIYGCMCVHIHLCGLESGQVTPTHVLRVRAYYCCYLLMSSQSQHTAHRSHWLINSKSVSLYSLIWEPSAMKHMSFSHWRLFRGSLICQMNCLVLSTHIENDHNFSNLFNQIQFSVMNQRKPKISTIS